MNEHQTQSSSRDSLYAKELIVRRKASIGITRPRTDDRRVWDVVFGVYGFPAVLLAHKLKPFLCSPIDLARCRRYVRRSESNADRRKRS